jgi:protein-disulfide isomerase
VMELMAKYKGKIRFAYKHLPLSFHPQAMPAAQYYEAILLQSPEKAWEFHDEIYKNQRKLQNGEAFFKELAKKLKVDMVKLAKDVKSEAVQKHIDADIAEAGKFGFQGTPGFLLNGIPVKGAYPASHFDGLIEELKKRGKITL